jgi:hypothetical protein
MSEMDDRPDTIGLSTIRKQTTEMLFIGTKIVRSHLQMSRQKRILSTANSF